MIKSRSLAVIALLAVMSFSAFSQQTQPGAGNAKAIALAQRSPEVQSAQHFLIEQAHRPRIQSFARRPSMPSPIRKPALPTARVWTQPKRLRSCSNS